MFKEETIDIPQDGSGAAETHSPDPLFSLGTARNPDGHTIRVDRRSLLWDGKPWLPVMGEFHYARYPRREWRDELLKMKLGGIDIVATYVFWIHHEEIQGEFDWSGRRNLRAFVALCGELGLTVVVRCGPWCHGECRNGGLPDWLLESGVKPRSDDPAYLRPVRRLYEQIAAQISGLLWKDGGPVVGIQCENEYEGPAEHILTLKRIAVEVGLDTPLYTRTGWPELTSSMPLGQILPLFGGYPDGFWDRSISEMPPGFADNFLFRLTRNDATVATDQLGIRLIGEEPENAQYPYFACEIGGGMMCSYHRRIRIAPADITALGLAKLGSGNNLQGYYMYHGGTNPEGRLSTLQESQATGYWNDLPVKTYDFQAPLGEFGQVREHYHTLRRMHLFLRDWGAALATMPTVLPPDAPTSAADIAPLRWALRTDGRSGFLFVSNYQRLQPMPARDNVRFALPLAGGETCLPREPITVPADRCFFWPVALDLGGGAYLRYATAQPICRLEDDGDCYIVFAQTEGIPTEFVFDAATAILESSTGTVQTIGDEIRIGDLRPGTEAAIHLRTRDGANLHMLLLDPAQSLRCWKATLWGRERLLLTGATLLAENEALRLLASDPEALAVGILPAPAALIGAGRRIAGERDGLFQRFAVDAGVHRQPPFAVSAEKIRSAGPVREVTPGSQGVAEAPHDDAFEQAAVWRLHLPPGTERSRDLLLQIGYTGDIARLYLDGRLLTDNFYNGAPFEIGLRRYAPEIYSGELLLKILPLRDDAPIYLPAEARARAIAPGSAEAAPQIIVIEQYEVELTMAAERAEAEPPLAPPLSTVA